MTGNNTNPEGKAINENMAVCFVMLILSVVVCTRCSLNSFYPTQTYMDSSVYLYIAKVMRSGGVMYRDVFDHKGPLLYLINYFGTVINQKHGVWLLELASFFLTSFFSYRIIRWFCTPVLSMIGAVCAVLLLDPFFHGGNNPEEYALPFITGSLLVFTEYFAEGKTSRTKLLLCGLCWMAVMLIRPNMIGCWIVFCVAVLIREIRNKTFQIGYFLVWFLAGAALLLFPIVVYLSFVGALRDFWNQYILFNLVYTDAEGANRLNMIQYYMCQPPVVISMCAAAVCACYDKAIREIAVIEFFFAVMTVCLTSISGRGYVHYGITLMPLYVLPVAFLLHAFNDATKGHILVTIVSMAAMVGLLIPWLRYIVQLPKLAPENNTIEYAISAFINENTEPGDVIISCGNTDVFYLYSDRMAASKYSYQLPIGEANPAIYGEFIEELSGNLPKVVITSSNTVNGILNLDELNRRMYAFLKENGYYEWLQIAGYGVYGQIPLTSEQNG
ncbi:MAG: hypothetical protein E7425_14595 [Ruminococcaceae bacterium]|nr:hypothetical protein [Oscillospiraceae bacterium]